MKGFVWVFALLCFFGSVQATDRAHYKSPNNCPLPDQDFSAWSVIGVLPVGARLESLEMLGNLIAPIETPNGPVYEKEWMKVAKLKWGWTEDDFAAHYMDFQQGHFRLEEIPPCTVFLDQIYGGSKPPNPIPADWYAPAPRNFGKLVLFDPIDHKPGLAWVSKVNNKHDAYYFQGCANPSIKPLFPAKIEIRVDDKLPKGVLVVEKLGRNLSRGQVEFQKSVDADPGEVVEFRVTVSAREDSVYAVTLRDALAAGLVLEELSATDTPIDEKELFGIGSSIAEVRPENPKRYLFSAKVVGAFPVGESILPNLVTAFSNQAKQEVQDRVAVRVVTAALSPEIKEIITEKEVVKEVSVPCPDCNPCAMPEWKGKTTQDIGKYWPKRSKARKVHLHELLEGQHGFWLVDDQTMINGLNDRIISEFQKDKELKWDAKKLRFNRKVQVAHINYDFCTAQYVLDVYWEGWHWKEYFLGVLTGLPIGFGIGRATAPGEVKIIEKAPWFLDPGTRPMTFLPKKKEATGFTDDPRDSFSKAAEPPPSIKPVHQPPAESLLEFKRMVLEEKGLGHLIALWE